MQIELSPDDTETIIREADAAARRLRRRLCLPICEREDLGQDLLVDLLRRLPAYDPARGSIGAFANIVLRNQSSRIATRHHRRLRAQGGMLLSLEAPAEEGAEPIGSPLTEEDGLAAWHGQGFGSAEDTEARLDLARAFSCLPGASRRFCAVLARRAVADLAECSGISRSALYRRLADLRLDLAMRGIGGRWDGSEAR